jgi:acetolactate synthase-1/2/3 large subunit
VADDRMRLADYVARRIAEHGIRHVFMLTGGGAMHLNDALGRAEGLHYGCCHHEQAAAMAAESYARLSGRMAAVNVTTGPGGINALNGVHGAYTDSIPMLILSGQVKRETLRHNATVLDHFQSSGHPLPAGKGALACRERPPRPGVA